jgi:hypothetical protein
MRRGGVESSREAGGSLQCGARAVTTKVAPSGNIKKTKRSLHSKKKVEMHSENYLQRCVQKVL